MPHITGDTNMGRTSCQNLSLLPTDYIAPSAELYTEERLSQPAFQISAGTSTTLSEDEELYDEYL